MASSFWAGLGAALALGRTGEDLVTLDIGQAAEYGEHQAPVARAVSAQGSANERNCALASTIRLTMPNRSTVPREAANLRHRHHVTGGEPVEHLVKLAAVERAHAPVAFSR
jgi:hypothetical protein